MLERDEDIVAMGIMIILSIIVGGICIPLAWI